MTLLSLPPAPLLQIVVGALQRHPNAVWLSLASMLIHQLDPPPLTSLLSVPSEEAKATVLGSLPLILDACLRFLQPDGAMESVSKDFSILILDVQPLFLESRHRAGLFWLYGNGCPTFRGFVLPTSPWRYRGIAPMFGTGSWLTRTILSGIGL